MCALVLALPRDSAQAQEAPTASADAKCIMIELYVSDDQTESELALAAAQHVAESRPGLKVVTRSITGNEDAQQRLRRIADYFHFEATQTPVIYCCNRAIWQADSEDDFETQLRSALQLVVFTRPGCPRCDQVKKYLPSLQQRFPGVEVIYRDLGTDAEAQLTLGELVRKHQAAVSFPITHVCDQLVVGFEHPNTTGVRIQQALDRWSTKCPSAGTSDVGHRRPL
jgi:hypothetical protein